MSDLNLGSRARDLTGQKFGRWTVMEFAGRVGRSRLLWKCLCDCGKENVVFGENLSRGLSVSCGCYRAESAARTSLKHGYARVGAKTPEYLIWEKMMGRCNCKTGPNWKDYGGRGITVCDRWKSFVNFIEDMGLRPSPKHMIERTDNDKGYEPSNCIWATREVQANNKRNSVKLTHNGRTLTIAQWARETGIGYFTLIMRVKNGWSAERALTQPVRPRSSS